MGVTGEEGRPPVKVGFSIADIGTGMWAVIGTLAALRVREQNGIGDHIDVSLLETILSWQTYLAEAYLLAGDVPRPLGSAHPTIAPYQTFQASDGYFTLAVGNDSLWNRFCDVLDTICKENRWYREPAYAHNADRVEARETLSQALSSVFLQRPRSDWLQWLTGAGIPAGSVNTVAEALEHPQVQARALLYSLEHPTVGRVPMVQLPITFTYLEKAVPTAPPLLGADTHSLLRELAHMREE